eukprot:364774-Chlamydomonas_euryale.AAC.23
MCDTYACRCAAGMARCGLQAWACSCAVNVAPISTSNMCHECSDWRKMPAVPALFQRAAFFSHPSSDSSVAVITDRRKVVTAVPGCMRNGITVPPEAVTSSIADGLSVVMVATRSAA